MLDVYTSQYNYKGENRLDITIKGGDPLGKYFAPTWELLMNYKNKRITKDQYTSIYYDLMRKRYLENNKPFNELLSRKKIVMVCFERPEEGFCHRYILSNILSKLGAQYRGELKTNGEYWGMVDLKNFNDSKR